MTEPPRQESTPLEDHESVEASGSVIARRELHGHVLAGVLGFTFFAMLAVSIYQLDFWQNYFFHDSLSLENVCRVDTAFTATREEPATFDASRKIVVPHPTEPLFTTPLPPDKFAHAVYTCEADVSAIPRADGSIIIHVGWIVADEVRIYVNGTERAAQSGTDKAVVPLMSSDLTRDSLTLKIWAWSKRSETIGLIGKAPLVIAEGIRKNSKVFGLEVSLQQIRGLYNLLPVLTLSLILIFGWWLGIRSRIMVTTLFYFLAITCRYLLTSLEDLAPWSSIKTYPLQGAFYLASFLSYVIFGMEILGLGRRWIRRSMLATIVLVGAEFVCILLFDSVDQLSVQLEKIHYLILLLTTSALLFFGLRKRRTDTVDAARARVNGLFLVCTGVFILVSMADYILAQYAVPIRFSSKMDILMPLFVGGVVLYTLALIDKHLRREREQRVKMEGDLAFAAKLQDVIVPSDLHGQACGWGYEIESKAFGILGGDWVKVYAASERAFFMLGDVVGKGPSAALTHSGIAAIWDNQVRLWDAGGASGADVVEGINTTMFNLFKGAMNTTFAAAVVQADGKVQIAAAGNYWLHLTAAKCSLLPPTTRALIGIGPQLSVTFKELQIAPGDWLLCFTDGVLEGNRAVKRFFTAVEGRTATLTAKEIRQLLAEAGAATVQPDDASVLILRFDASMADGTAA